MGLTEPTVRFQEAKHDSKWSHGTSTIAYFVVEVVQLSTVTVTQAKKKMPENKPNRFILVDGVSIFGKNA